MVGFAQWIAFVLLFWNFEFGLLQNCEVQTNDETLRRLLAGVINDALVETNEKLTAIQNNINQLSNFGSSYSNAASSCAEIQKSRANSPSGYYYTRNSAGSPTRVYCDMTLSCGGITGGWMRVANLDMTDSSQTCPYHLRQRTDSSRRTCAAYSDSAGCSSVTYRSNSINYRRVCGKVRAYQGFTMDGFHTNARERQPSIDSNYVDGISFTHGRFPRKHIWTLAARNECPCGPVPAYVRNDFFCDGSNNRIIDFANPLWDGGSCGTNRCCTLNNPPWFYRQLPRQTNDDIEVRVCRDQSRRDEDLLVEAVEIYIQ